MENERQTFPLQARSKGYPDRYASVNRHVYMAAYEVYSYIYRPQQAMLEGGCRGGFGTGEMLAFLYARAFPKTEWKSRVDEAFLNMDIE